MLKTMVKFLGKKIPWKFKKSTYHNVFRNLQDLMYKKVLKTQTSVDFGSWKNRG